MALQLPLQYKTLTIEAAYIRAVLPQIALDKEHMSFGVWVWPSEASANDPANQLPDLAITIMDAPYDLAGADPLAQAYVYLKTLPAYVAAEDR